MIKSKRLRVCKGCCRIVVDVLAGCAHCQGHHFTVVDEAIQHCRVCGCTNEAACNDGGRGCYWVNDSLCSVCHRKQVAHCVRGSR